MTARRLLLLLRLTLRKSSLEPVTYLLVNERNMRIIIGNDRILIS